MAQQKVALGQLIAVVFSEIAMLLILVVLLET
jgi:hypothetical protein